MYRKSKNNSVVAVIVGTIVACTAIASAVYFIIKFFEKKRDYDYIECDCCDDDECDCDGCCDMTDDTAEQATDDVTDSE